MKRGDDHFSSSACRGCWKDVAAVAEVEADRQGMQQTSALSTERLLAAPSEEKNREGWDRISKVAGLKEELSGPTQRSCSDTRFRVRRITCRVLDVNLDLTL
ncbi:hypothetical protein OJAV_G00044840 [Oryzias javanicus]|uniref:Uncharacterized protein n=1 Tax=Oryzias javanicus TaxID=123683 RepID=A0A437DDW6_ORYJA|nr:hypothetical protein OJAV_G00044840 [Oryzias javanicus]